MRYFRRRTCLLLLPAGVLVGLRVRDAVAGPPAPVVAAPTAAIGGLVHALAGNGVTIRVDRTLPFDSVRIGTGDPVPIAGGVLLKGASSARARFLDDARNALKAAGNLRTALADARVGSPSGLETAHKAWSRNFARQVLTWQHRLSTFALRGQAVRDRHGRIYLLEWAGAKVDPKAGRPSPAALATAPQDAAKPTAAGYTAYVEALVRSLA